MSIAVSLSRIRGRDTFQAMLSKPVTENAVNVDAAEMVKNNISLYRQMVLQYVRNSLHPEELPEIEKEPGPSLKFYQPAKGSSLSTFCQVTNYNEHSAFTAAISETATGISSILLQDYHRTWPRIATSKARDHLKDSASEDPEFMGNSHDWKAEHVKRTDVRDEYTHNATISLLIRKQRKQTATGVFEIELENHPSPDVPELRSEGQRADEDRQDNQEE